MPVSANNRLFIGLSATSSEAIQGISNSEDPYVPDAMVTPLREMLLSSAGSSEFASPQILVEDVQRTIIGISQASSRIASDIAALCTQSQTFLRESLAYTAAYSDILLQSASFVEFEAASTKEAVEATLMSLRQLHSLLIDGDKVMVEIRKCGQTVAAVENALSKMERQRGIASK